MNGAPLYWEQFIDIGRYNTLHALQNAIKAHEVSLMKAPDTFDLNKRLKALEAKSTGNKPFKNYKFKYNSKTNKVNKHPSKGFKSKRKAVARTFAAIGFHPSIKPKYPRDDSVVSKGKTPEQKGARPCRHCGSPKHWDFDCKRPKDNDRKAKTFLASSDESYIEAYAAYEKCYLEDEDSENEEAETHTVEVEDKSDSSSSSDDERESISASEDESSSEEVF